MYIGDFGYYLSKYFAKLFMGWCFAIPLNKSIFQELINCFFNINSSHSVICF